MRWGVLGAVVCLALLASACGRDGESAGGNGASAAGSGLPAITFTTAKGETVVLSVEVADDPDEKQCGLMHRTSLPADQGMIFAYTEDTGGGFWMRNTLIPLSIAYASGDGRIVDILDMQPVPAPGNTPYLLPDGRNVAVADGQPVPAGAVWVTYPPRGMYRYAIEVNQGWFATHGIAVGDRVDPAVTIGASAGTPPPICRERGV